MWQTGKPPIVPCQVKIGTLPVWCILHNTWIVEDADPPVITCTDHKLPICTQQGVILTELRVFVGPAGKWQQQLCLLIQDMTKSGCVGYVKFQMRLVKQQSMVIVIPAMKRPQ
jgi:hypothetical protein